MNKQLLVGLILSLSVGSVGCRALTKRPSGVSLSSPKPSAPVTIYVPTSALTIIGVPGKPMLHKFVEGLEKPTYLTYSPIYTDLLYVTEQRGRVRLIQKGAVVSVPFLDLTDRVGSSGNEQGLLSLAFAPDFAQSRKFYVDYTDTNGDTVVSGFMSASDGRSADPNSEWEVIKIGQPYANHNGGQLEFGPDGMLYIGMGDGGSQGDPQNRAQNPNELLGKILRLDVSRSSTNAPYVVSNDHVQAGRPEVWALGLRNPWRFSFDRVTGDIYIADVGQDTIEEVDMLPAKTSSGTNFGWNILEGTDKYSGGSKDGLTAPIWEYRHGSDGCSVTGGYVYRGPTLSALTGAYVYGDYCSGKVWTLRRSGPGSAGKWMNKNLFDTGYSITSFGEDALGELYVLNRDGTVYKLVGK